jgi:hypothetical protein
MVRASHELARLLLEYPDSVVKALTYDGDCHEFNELQYFVYNETPESN